MAKHCVVTRERMTSEFDGSKRLSLLCTEDIDNGNVVVLGKLASRELYEYAAPKGTEDVSEIVLITTPEVMADSRLKSLSDFYNEAGKAMTGDLLFKHDIFSLTAEGFEGTPAAEKFVKLGTGTKLVVADDETGAIGKIVDVINGKFAVQVL